ncbi:Hypothetical predicted protein [Pelobates cultripes]|uniref:Uncharacterized protein n=1 Tax=Pelobates cultripes TaxID=61616 RepID=A0AAD1S2Q0_PELCU|nr:Hypothetical predicted protein [Pelobates cultripes]
MNRDIGQRQRAQHLPHPCTAAQLREPEKTGPPRAPTTSGGTLLQPHGPAVRDQKILRSGTHGHREVTPKPKQARGSMRLQHCMRELKRHPTNTCSQRYPATTEGYLAADAENSLPRPARGVG